MATCLNKLDLTAIDDNMLDIYKKLMKATTGEDSLYLKAKETLQAVMEESNIDDREKAQLLANTLGSLAANMSDKSMETAFALAKDERDANYQLAKLCADTAVAEATADKVANEAELIDTEKDLKVAQGWLVQAQLYRDYGAIPDQLAYSKTVLGSTEYTSTYGTKYQTLVKAQADTYATYANSYRTNGEVTYSLTQDGRFNEASADAAGLTYMQTGVAARQIQGFDDNQRQHVVNSSASMIGLLLSTEASGINYDPYLASWNTAVNYLSVDHTTPLLP